MNDGSEARPDGRSATEETRRLRVATRALRNHLDDLPIDYDLDVSGDRFLAGLAVMSARQRYDCADSMIGAGFGGTVIGAIARSLFVDGLRWLWIGDQPERRRCLLGDLLAERDRLCRLLKESETSCPILVRWLMPLPDVADLTGQSLTWLDAQSMPSEDELLDDFLSRWCTITPASADGEHAPLLARARTLLNMAGLRGAVLVLAHAGHGNFLGLQSSLTEHGTTGHDLRPDHEALFMQIAAVGVTATLLGAAAAIPERWPTDVDRGPFLDKAVELAEAVAAAAVSVHKLVGSRLAPRPHKATKMRAPGAPTILLPGAVVDSDELLPEINSVDAVVEAAEAYFELATSVGFNLWEYGAPTLHTALGYAGGHSHLETVISTYDQPGSGVTAVFAARMLLEEAARLTWRFSEAGENAFKARAKQFFDEYRARRKKAIGQMVGTGVPTADADRIFELPRNVIVPGSDDNIAKGRTPLPSISSMLREMGKPFPEPGWLELAYSLLSQITHSTPVGLLHTVRVRNGTWHGNELSTEMLGLTLDTACLGSAVLIGHSAVVLTNLSTEAVSYRTSLLAAATRVHDAARLVHGLD